MATRLLFTLFLALWVFFTTARTQDIAYFCPPCNRACDTIAYESAGQCLHCGMQLQSQSKQEKMEKAQNTAAGRKRVAAIIHEGMEILDFAGPVEVFTTAGFEVYTVASSREPIISQGVVQITPQYSIANCPPPDIIAVFGGNSSSAIQDGAMIEWIRKTAPEVELLFSVCTGAFYYAKAGLLDGKRVTTFHESIDALREAAPQAEVVSGVKYADAGRVVTAAGVSSGIDGALYVVERYMGKEAAYRIAEYMEYTPWMGR